MPEHPPRYFPLDRDAYAMTMPRAIPGPLVEVDAAEYAAEMALKDRILASDSGYHFQCPAAAEPLAWEAVALLLPDAARAWPDCFALQTRGASWAWTNHLRGTQVTFALGDAAALPLPPLDWLGRQVQEDLILMSEDGDGGAVCAAGHLCFAAGWCLGDKMGRDFLAVHDDVPQFRDRVGRPADLLMRRLKPGRPVERFNWGIAGTDRLNLSPATRDEWLPSQQGVTPSDAGKRCFLRTERQTLSRLPQTRGILFTVHTYRDPVAAHAADPARRRRLARVLRDLPPETRDYKGITPFYDALLAYLEEA